MIHVVANQISCLRVTGIKDGGEVTDRARRKRVLSRRIVYSIYYNSTLLLPDRVWVRGEAVEADVVEQAHSIFYILQQYSSLT